jgi:GNAT superfamily N-acetyltransferase
VDLEISEPRTADELESYYRLRFERLRKPHGQPRGSERDHPLEADSSHLVAKVDNRVVGGICWALLVRSGGLLRRRRPYVRARQLVVDPEFEGQGIGGALMLRMEERCRAAGAVELVANVRVENVEMFEGRGWIVTGDGETLFGTVEHRSMAKSLTGGVPSEPRSG